MAHSVAFHNGDLTLEERLAVENAFRKRELRCIVSTSTLSMGVNLPASTVLIVKPTKWTKDAKNGWQEVPQTVAEYRNMSGRAGRFGLVKDDVGRSILIAKTPLEQESYFKKYVQGLPEPIDSAFRKESLDLSLLRCIASGLCNTADGTRRFLLKTFAARRIWNDDESRSVLDKEILRVIAMLRRNGLTADETDGKFSATNLGRICASSGLAIPTFILLLQAVKQRKTSSIDLALLASSCTDTGPDSIPISLSTSEYQGRSRFFVRTLSDACQQEVAPSTVGFLDALPTMDLPEYNVVRQLKYTCIAAAYIGGVASRNIENQLGISAGRARTVGRHCSWLLETAAGVAWSLGMAIEARAYERLAERFSFGCTDDAMILAYIPHTLHRAEREMLVGAGYNTLQKIIETPAMQIAQNARVNRPRVIGLQDGIVKLLGPTLDLEKSQTAKLTAKGLSVAPLEALYAMTGIALEQAIENILCPPFCSLVVTRFTTQRHSEPDLKMILTNGRVGIVQVTAKDHPTDKVSMTKSGSILQQAPELAPEVFACIGRPDFDDDAIKNAIAHAKNGRNFKLIPVSVLAEMYVRFFEGTITGQRVIEIFESETGHITIDRL
jgi:hypothetical protein